MSNDRPTLHPESTLKSSRYPFSRDRLFLTCGLASALLFWAAFDDHSDGFYTFLRIYVCGLSLLWAFFFRSLERPAWALAAVCSAILFNPIFEIEFAEDDWKVIDFIAGAAFGWMALQPYALLKTRPFVPYLPAVAMAGIAFVGSVDLQSSRGFGSSEATMNVDETLTTENVVGVDMPAVDAGLPAWQLAPPIAVGQSGSSEAQDELSESPKDPALSSPTPYADYTLNTRPDGTTALPPTANRRWLDEALGRTNSSRTGAPALPDRAEPLPEPPTDTFTENDGTAMDANMVVGD